MNKLKITKTKTFTKFIHLKFLTPVEIFWMKDENGLSSGLKRKNLISGELI